MNFETDVLEASCKNPVLVEFFAQKTKNSFLPDTSSVVRVDAQKNHNVARRYTSVVPALIVFSDRHPTDGIVGTLSQKAVKIFLQTLGLAPQNVLEAAQAALDSGDYVQAAQLFAQAAHSGDSQALAGLALCYIHTEDLARAHNTLKTIPDSQKNTPMVKKVQAQIFLAQKAAQVPDVAQLQERVSKNSQDYQARFDLALALYKDDFYEEAVEALLQIVKEAPNWNDGAGKRQLLEFFEALPSHNATVTGRRKLSSLLFR